MDSFCSPALFCFFLGYLMWPRETGQAGPTREESKLALGSPWGLPGVPTPRSLCSAGPCYTSLPTSFGNRLYLQCPQATDETSLRSLLTTECKERKGVWDQTRLRGARPAPLCRGGHWEPQCTVAECCKKQISKDCSLSALQAWPGPVIREGMSGG